MSEENDKTGKKAAESSSSKSSSSSSKSAAAKSGSSSTASRSSTASASSKSSTTSSSTAEAKASSAGATTASNESATAKAAGGSGQPQHVASGIAYVLGPITGLFFLFADRNDSVVRYHACQALLLSAVIAVAWIAVAILSAPLAGIPLVFWAGLAFLLYMAYLAFKSKSWEIPFLNDYAQRFADKMAPQGEQKK